MQRYARLPAGATLDVEPFRAHVDEEKLQNFKKLLELSPIAPPLFENTNVGRKYGIEREWLMKAKQTWLNDFDWRKCENRINSFPNFIAFLKDEDGNEIKIQFLALFSERKDAIPIACFHGWPGSICEFLDVLDLLRERYSPQDLPYHVIIPPLPGYAYSSGLPPEMDCSIGKVAAVMNDLMIGLGFGFGYVAHGGDLGSFVSRTLALQYDACKGMHVNLMVPNPPPDGSTPSEAERRALEKAADNFDTGYAFGLLQGTRPATVGFALSASPLSLLSWVGEKFLEWSEVDPPLDKILEGVTLYWMTDTIARGLYHSRELRSSEETPRIARISKAMEGISLPFITKPSGYSLFAHEIVPSPRSMAARSCNLVWFNEHEHGGHFAAMERPEELLDDVEQYAQMVWEMIQSESI